MWIVFTIVLTSDAKVGRRLSVVRNMGNSAQYSLRAAAAADEDYNLKVNDNLALRRG